MAENTLQFSCTIQKDPTTVLAFIADVQNRVRYQQSLTDVSEVQGDAGVGQTWRWQWEMLGHTLAGTGKSVEYEPGKRYVFETKGDAESRFSYDVQPEGEGTELKLEVTFQPPSQLGEQADKEQLLQIARQKGNESLAKLKQVIEQ